MNQKTRKPPPIRQDTPGPPVDYAHRATVNLVAVIAVLVLGGCLLWIFQGLEEHRKLERCISAGRKDCAAFAAPPGPRP